MIRKDLNLRLEGSSQCGSELFPVNVRDFRFISCYRQITKNNKMQRMAKLFALQPNVFVTIIINENNGITNTTNCNSKQHNGLFLYD